MRKTKGVRKTTSTPEADPEGDDKASNQESAPSKHKRAMSASDMAAKKKEKLEKKKADAEAQKAKSKCLISLTILLFASLIRPTV